MSKKEKTKFYVVDTNSNAERQELVQYVAGKHLSVAVVGTGEGFQYAYVSTGEVWFVTIIKEEYFKKIKNATHFKSLNEFIKHLDGDKDEQ